MAMVGLTQGGETGIPLVGFLPGLSRRRVRGGFTLIELMVATAVFALILGLAFSVISQTTSLWRRATRDLETFQNARMVFENVTRMVSQATLNTYWDYAFNAAGQATRYRRNSDLHFYLAQAGLQGSPGTPGSGQVLFFQAPHGRRGSASGWLPQALNEIGFYVEFGSNAQWLPQGLDGVLQPAWRYRLMQAVQPAEDVTVYKTSPVVAHPPPWISTARAYPVADNIIALVILPGRSAPEEARLGPLVTDLAYDSRDGADQAIQPVTANQLPPFLYIAMIAIDERSAARIASGGTPPTQITSALQGRFERAADFQADLKEVEEYLVGSGITCRVFATRVLLKESKWSE